MKLVIILMVTVVLSFPVEAVTLAETEESTLNLKQLLELFRGEPAATAPTDQQTSDELPAEAFDSTSQFLSQATPVPADVSAATQRPSTPMSQTLVSGPAVETKLAEIVQRYNVILSSDLNASGSGIKDLIAEMRARLESIPIPGVTTPTPSKPELSTEDSIAPVPSLDSSRTWSSIDQAPFVPSVNDVSLLASSGSLVEDSLPAHARIAAASEEIAEGTTEDIPLDVYYYDNNTEATSPEVDILNHDEQVQQPSQPEDSELTSETCQAKLEQVLAVLSQLEDYLNN